MADSIDERTVSLEGAQRVIAAALALARTRDLQVSVAVADRSGALKGFGRMDGASLLSGETARRKAFTVAYVGISTQEFGTILKSELESEPELFHGMIGIDGLVAFAGGVPLIVDGHRIGAVAVSGATSAADQEIAQSAARTLTEPAAR